MTGRRNHANRITPASRAAGGRNSRRKTRAAPKIRYSNGRRRAILGRRPPVSAVVADISTSVKIGFDGTLNSIHQRCIAEIGLETLASDPLEQVNIPFGYLNPNVVIKFRNVGV